MTHQETLLALLVGCRQALYFPLFLFIFVPELGDEMWRDFVCRIKNRRAKR